MKNTNSSSSAFGTLVLNVGVNLVAGNRERLLELLLAGELLGRRVEGLRQDDAAGRQAVASCPEPSAAGVNTTVFGGPAFLSLGWRSRSATWKRVVAGRQLRARG